MSAVDALWLVVEPVDMRLGIDGLSSLLQNGLKRTPCDGATYVFRNKRGTRLKLLRWDGTGVWLCQRRLHRGLFHWPDAASAFFTLSEAQWRWLVRGIEWQRLEAKTDSNWHL